MTVKNPRMTPDELLTEVNWFLDFGVHPEQIATQLHRTPESIYKVAWRVGDVRVRDVFASQKVRLLSSKTPARSAT